MPDCMHWLATADGSALHLMRFRGPRADKIRFSPKGMGVFSVSTVPFIKENMRRALAELAAQGVFVGTSSWKYKGWIGQLYSADRYAYRGKIAKARFERNCLSEYAEVFKTVCLDAAYYAFPTAGYLEGLASQVPSDFRFGMKVTDEITLKRFPNLTRSGVRTGQRNENFLNSGLFIRDFIEPCESIRPKIGILIFEFSRFRPADYAKGADFVADLDNFLAALPEGWPYGIEMRNRLWLTPEYFDCLSRHGAAHVFNSWEAMPPVSAQMKLPGSRTNADLAAARFLLKPGRKYEAAVKAFEPYEKTREVNDEARQAGADLIKERKAGPGQARTFIYVNNRLEGNALETITAMLALAEPH